MSLNYNYFYLSNIGKIHSLNPPDAAWPNDIEFDEKTKQEIMNLYREVGSSEETVERSSIQQLQLQSTLAKYHTSMNKVLSKFYSKYKDTLIYYYNLKGEQINQLLTQLVEKNNTELKFVVEWIVEEINKKMRKKQLICLQNFV